MNLLFFLLLLLLVLMTKSETSPPKDPAVVAIEAARDYARMQAYLEANHAQSVLDANTELLRAEMEVKRLAELRSAAQMACGTSGTCFQSYYEKLVTDDRAHRENMRLKLKREAAEEAWTVAKYVVGGIAAVTGTVVLLSKQ